MDSPAASPYAPDYGNKSIMGLFRGERKRLGGKAWISGAGDRIRTGDIDLGKVALYQLSYSRSAYPRILAPWQSRCQIAGRNNLLRSCLRPSGLAVTGSFIRCFFGP